MKKSKLTRQPNNTIFIGVTGTFPHFGMFVSLSENNTVTKFKKEDINKMEVRYWYKSTWDGIMGDVKPHTLITEAKMEVFDGPLPLTTRVIGMSLDRKELYSAAISEDGQLEYKLMHTGPKWIINHEFMVHTGKTLMLDQFEEPKQKETI